MHVNEDRTLNVSFAITADTGPWVIELEATVDDSQIRQVDVAFEPRRVDELAHPTGARLPVVTTVSPRSAIVWSH